MSLRERVRARVLGTDGRSEEARGEEALRAERERLEATRRAGRAERLAADAHRLDLRAQVLLRSDVLAREVADGTRCGLSSGEVAPLVEIAVAVAVLARDRGVEQELPAVDELRATAEDLATRNARRGYHGLVPLGPLIGCLYGWRSPSGDWLGFERTGDYLRAVADLLPEGNRARLGALQSMDDLTHARLALLSEASVHYCS